MTREIPLTQGRVALVDDADFEWLNQWKWTYHRGGYAYRRPWSKNRQSVVYMHRLIMDAPAGVKVDHRDHDGRNNQRANLRLVTDSQNSANQLKSKRPLTSKYKGVSWSKSSSRWLVATKDHGRRIPVGYFKNEVEAARAYDRKARELFGEFAFCNFEVDS